MSDTKKKLIIFSLAVVIGLIWMFTPDKEIAAEKQFLVAQDIYITGIIKNVITTNYHGRGVIYLQNIKSNKSPGYECSFKSDRLVCRIGNNEAMILGISGSEFATSDSVVYNTQSLKYQIYKKGKLQTEDGISLSEEDSFYHEMKVNGYLDFSYYHK